VPERLQLAERFGGAAVNFANENVRERVLHATAGRGADVVLEVVGSPAAARSAFELVRPGGVISTVGVHTEADMAFSPVEAYDKNLTYKNGRCPARFYMQKLIPLVQSQRYDLSAIISHRLPLSRGAEGYRMFDRKLEGCTKVVLRP